MNAGNCYRLAKYLLDFYVSSKKTRPKEIVLDFDGSCFPAHGDQQGTAYRSYYETNMYFPLLVFDQDGCLLAAILRPGNQSEIQITVAVLKRIVEHLRRAWPGIKVTFRADAGFTSRTIYEWCESNDVSYLIRVKAGWGGGGMRALAKQYVRSAAHKFKRRFGEARFTGKEGQKDRGRYETEIKLLPAQERVQKLSEYRHRCVREYGAFYYEAGQGSKRWGKDRRIIVVADHTDTGSKNMFLVTNIENEVPQRLYEGLYCQRGKAELCIRDFKALKATKLSCSSFGANQCRLLFHALAYTLMHQLRLHLPVSAGQLTVKCMQERFIRVAASIKDSTRRIHLQWTSFWQWEKQLMFLSRRLRLLPLRS